MNDEIECNLVIQKDVYDTVERVSRKLGMEPTAWMSLVVSTKLKDMGL